MPSALATRLGEFIERCLNVDTQQRRCTYTSDNDIAYSDGRGSSYYVSNIDPIVNNIQMRVQANGSVTVFEGYVPVLTLLLGTSYILRKQTKGVCDSLAYIIECFSVLVPFFKLDQQNSSMTLSSQWPAIFSNHLTIRCTYQNISIRDSNRQYTELTNADDVRRIACIPLVALLSLNSQLVEQRFESVVKNAALLRVVFSSGLHLQSFNHITFVFTGDSTKPDAYRLHVTVASTSVYLFCLQHPYRRGNYTCEDTAGLSDFMLKYRQLFAAPASSTLDLPLHSTVDKADLILRKLDEILQSIRAQPERAQQNRLNDTKQAT